MATDETVKVPVVGPEKKSTVMLFAVAGVAVIMYAVMSKKKAAAAAAAAAANAGAAGVGSGAFTDPAGNTCAAPDPVTGYCPNSPEDISAQGQLQAYGGSTGLSVSPLTGQASSNSSVPVFTDNGSWAQYVEQLLGSNGSDAMAAAIAKYLSGQSLTDAQVTTVEQAIAIANYPPVSGSGGKPPSMNTTAADPAAVTAPPVTTTPPADTTGSGTLANGWFLHDLTYSEGYAQYLYIQQGYIIWGYMIATGASNRYGAPVGKTIGDQFSTPTGYGPHNGPATVANVTDPQGAPGWGEGWTAASRPAGTKAPASYV